VEYPQTELWCGVVALARWLWEYSDPGWRETTPTDSLTGYRPSPFVTGSPSYRLSPDEVQELRLWLETADLPDSVGNCAGHLHGRLEECDA
jgi:hypothetical protein